MSLCFLTGSLLNSSGRFAKDKICLGSIAQSHLAATRKAAVARCHCDAGAAIVANKGNCNCRRSVHAVGRAVARKPTVRHGERPPVTLILFSQRKIMPFCPMTATGIVV